MLVEHHHCWSGPYDVIKQYILTLTELKQKGKRQKLKTFTMPLLSDANQTALLLASAYNRLVAMGSVYACVYNYVRT